MGIGNQMQLLTRRRKYRGVETRHEDGRRAELYRAVDLSGTDIEVGTTGPQDRRTAGPQEEVAELLRLLRSAHACCCVLLCAVVLCVVW